MGPDGKAREIKITEATHKEFGLAVQAQIATVNAVAPKTREGRYQPTYWFFRQTFTLDEKSDVPIGSLTRALALEPDGNAPKVFTKQTVDQAAVPKIRVAPEYPVSLMAKGPKGEATIEWVVNEAGIPEAIRIVSATKVEFGYAAAQAVSLWRYNAATKDGKAVPMAASMTFTFVLQP